MQFIPHFRSGGTLARILLEGIELQFPGFGSTGQRIADDRAVLEIRSSMFDLRHILLGSAHAFGDDSLSQSGALAQLTQLPCCSQLRLHLDVDLLCLGISLDEFLDFLSIRFSINRHVTSGFHVSLPPPAGTRAPPATAPGVSSPCFPPIYNSRVVNVKNSRFPEV